MKTPRALALCALLALSATPVGVAAQPADKTTAEANKHFLRGVALYNEADYGAALVEFRRAYEGAPAYQVLYNVAGTYYQLKDYAGALRTFEQYLVDGGAGIAPERRAQVEQEIATLRLRVARVELTTSVPGMEITIDDVTIGKTPLTQPLLMSAGRRKIVAARAGYPSVTRILDVVGGDTLTLALEIPVESTHPASVSAASPPAGPRGELATSAAATPPRRTAGAAIPALPWIATGALAVGAAVTGVLALDASSDLATALDAFPGDTDAIASRRSRTTTFAIVTDLLGGAAVLAGGLSLSI